MCHRLYTESSWGQCTVTENDVDIVQIDLGGTDVSGAQYSLGIMKSVIDGRSEFTTAFNARPYQHWVIIAPGTSHTGTAYLGVRYGNINTPSYAVSLLRGPATSSWQATSHEIGHNLGLGHAGGYQTASGNYNAYQDDASMGYDRQREADFTAPARYTLGWIGPSQVKNFPSDSHAVIRALGEMPSEADNKVHMVKIPCAFCMTTDSQLAAEAGGDLFLSFRTIDLGRPFGVSSDIDIFDVDTRQAMTLEDHVHVHFSKTGSRTTELWKTLGSGAQWEVQGSTPGASTYIVVCNTATKTATPSLTSESAEVSISAASMSAAVAGCPNGVAAAPAPAAPVVVASPPPVVVASPPPVVVASPPPVVVASPPPVVVASPRTTVPTSGAGPAPPLSSMTLLQTSNAALSTTLAPAYSADHINDGDTGSLICTNVASNNDQWVSVQIPAGAKVDYVAVYNRADAVTYRNWINPYEIWLGASAGAMDTQCGGQLEADTSVGAGPFTTACGGGAGPFVTLVLRSGSARYLAIGEVEVYQAAAGAAPAPIVVASPPPVVVASPPPVVVASPPSVASPAAAGPAPPLNAMTRATLEEARSSTTYHAQYTPDKIIDGDTGTLCATNSARNNDQWVSVRAPAGTVINYVAVYNRADGNVYAGWLSPYDVYLGNDFGGTDVACGTNLNAPVAQGLGPFVTSCSGNSQYQYVTVKLNAGTQRWLTIGELEVYTQ